MSKLNKKLGGTVAFVLAALSMSVLSVALWAGVQSNYPVSVVINGDGSGYAEGALSTARYSANSTEFIGCAAEPGGYSCFAKSASGAFGLCTNASATAAEMEVVTSISDYASIGVTWNASGVCTNINVGHISWLLP